MNQPQRPPGSPLRHTSGSQIEDFQDLMSQRVQDTLLVSSMYDTFILQEDGQLSELILGEFLGLNLHHTTGLTHVSSGAEALALAKEQPTRFNLIISAVNVGDMNAAELAAEVRNQALDIPVVLLAYDGGELADFLARNDVSLIERIFLWQGDTRILLAIVKYVEDRMNIAFDSGEAGVQVILLIEDSIRYYSSFLPLVYSEVIRHSDNLLSEGLNVAHKILRKRARPKIILCGTWEEAWGYFTTYGDEILGIISDIEFPQDGKLNGEAGVQFTRKVREIWPDIPVILQSGQQENEAVAKLVGAAFLLKGSSTLLTDLRRHMVELFYFGDFVFRMPDGTEVARARNMKELVERLRTVPAESVTWHAERNHFSRWLKARTEFALAEQLRPMRASDYTNDEETRRHLIGLIDDYRRELRQAVVSDYSWTSFDTTSSFSRIGNGSLGGKARALAFVRHLLSDFELISKYAGVQISVPPSVVLTTEVFDRFLEQNHLRDFALGSTDDQEIRRRFLEAEFPEDVVRDLASFLELIRYPLAVRSSSLLEDSQYQPLAGVYETYMLPNNHARQSMRLAQLQAAIKRVYASTFCQYAKNYFKATPYRTEEEKMAVILQKLVGSTHGDRFYPDVAGVARSYNFYPAGPMAPEDGIVAVALGLGRVVVEGEVTQSFCPRYPQHLMHFSTVKDMLTNSQRDFLALELPSPQASLDPQQEMRETRYRLETAEADGTLTAVASTYSPENDAVYDGLSRPGVRLVSMAPILKHKLFPLAEILAELLEIGAWGMNTPVEMEFAVRLSTPEGTPKEFGFLQMRPLARAHEVEDLDLGQYDRTQIVCESTRVLGNGTLDGLRDAVVVDYRRFDRARSHDAAREVARFNAGLVSEGLPYVLVGVGRWGSADPWLGIPVTWEQISGAKVIVESGLRDMRVQPSQGSHFFQNLTSFRVGYFTVNPEVGEGYVDWDWLAKQPAVEEATYARHLRFESPLVVKMSGKSQQGVILKPTASSPAS